MNNLVTTWVSASFMLAAATVATVGFIDEARMQDAPTAAACVNDWNARLGDGERRLVAAEGYRSAIVRGWFHFSAGCGVSFVAPGAHPYLVLTCTRSLDIADPAGVAWGCEWDTQVAGTITVPDPMAAANVIAGWHLALRANVSA